MTSSDKGSAANWLAPFRGKKPVDVRVVIPGSKSVTNRALILGALKGQSFKVSELPDSTDVLFLIDAFKKIGLKLIHNNNSVQFLNSFPECEKENSETEIYLETGDGGTTNRFLIALS